MAHDWNVVSLVMSSDTATFHPMDAVCSLLPNVTHSIDMPQTLNFRTWSKRQLNVGTKLLVELR